MSDRKRTPDSKAATLSRKLARQTKYAARSLDVESIAAELSAGKVTA